MKTSRLVVWAQHGIYGAGRSLDETFGLIETAEKAAGIFLKIAHLPWKQTLATEDLRRIAAHYGVKPRAGYLD
jgi:rhamnulose-1-phosphate aldolase